MHDLNRDAASDAPRLTYRIRGEKFEVGGAGFAEAIADAHTSHRRPQCMCSNEGVDMYVARFGSTYLIKRMPGTGSKHAPSCPSYEPPADLSGLGQALLGAVVEDPTTGETTLLLDFSLSRFPGRSSAPPTAGHRDSAATDGEKLSLRGLLHYLWDQSEQTRWHPGFAGKRSWNTVRKHLMQAAAGKNARGRSLLSQLYVPEVFSLDQRDAIRARRLSRWKSALVSPGQPQHLMLMIAELKELVPARYGYRAVVKHVPDQAFAVDEQLFRRLGRRFAAELSMWGACESLRMVCMGTFAVHSSGIPALVELCLMPVNNQWIPVDDQFDWQLVELLMRDGRAFIKNQRYNLPAGSSSARAVLTDTEAALPLFIDSDLQATELEDASTHGLKPQKPSCWEWRVAAGPIPPLPPRRQAGCADAAGL